MGGIPLVYRVGEESMKERNTVVVPIRVPKDTAGKIAEDAKRRNQSRNKWGEAAFMERLRKHGKKVQ